MILFHLTDFSFLKTFVKSTIKKVLQVSKKMLKSCAENKVLRMYVYFSISLRELLEREREREKEKKRDKKREREREIQRQREREKEKKRDIEKNRDRERKREGKRERERVRERKRQREREVKLHLIWCQFSIIIQNLMQKQPLLIVLFETNLNNISTKA